MRAFKKALLVFILIGGSFLCLLSCQRSSTPYKIYYLDAEKRHIDYSRVPKGDLENRPKEEEIKYFFPTGSYRLDIDDLYYEELPDISYDKDYDDGYDYIDSSIIEKDWNIMDLKGNILSELDIKNRFERVEVEDLGYYRTKTNLEGYQTIDEWYTRQAVEATFYCKKIKPIAVPEDLILDDNFIIRLYDKKGKVIDENKMRNEVAVEDYKRDPAGYQNKITDSGTDAWLIGMLKLPPKSQRESLKYRVLRLDKNGKPKPYLYEGAYKYPYQYYLYEAPLPPYSEINTGIITPLQAVILKYFVLSLGSLMISERKSYV
ncbi:MAG: hypothetical protein OXJ52_00335 [Oligoflexia bacterium]|nr:hypothetical protein [Oligoflexia bacterium]